MKKNNDATRVRAAATAPALAALSRPFRPRYVTIRQRHAHRIAVYPVTDNQPFDEPGNDSRHQHLPGNMGEERDAMIPGGPFCLLPRLACLFTGAHCTICLHCIALTFAANTCWRLGAAVAIIPGRKIRMDQLMVSSVQASTVNHPSSPMSSGRRAGRESREGTEEKRQQAKVTLSACQSRPSSRECECHFTSCSSFRT